MHRDDMRDAGKPRSPCAIDGHGEFVTVREIDAVAAKCGRQESRARRRKWTFDPKLLDNHAGALELTGKPALAISRNEHDARGTTSLKCRRQIGHDTFRAPWPVRLDQMCDAHSRQSARRGPYS